MVFEKNKDVTIIEQLGFAQCRLSLAIPKEEEYSGLEYFMNKKIATSYPKILSDFFKKNKITAEIEEISGSVEIAPGIGLADAVCDIVSSGSTLLTNGLHEVETILKSQAVIIGNKNLSPEKQTILNRLLFRIRAVKNAKENKYILLNTPESAITKICNILPGMKSPTIVPLVEKGWYSLHSVVKEDEFWERIDQLKACRCRRYSGYSNRENDTVMKIILLPEKERWDELCRRPGIDKTDLGNVVRDIINRVKSEKDDALFTFHGKI